MVRNLFGLQFMRREFRWIPALLVPALAGLGWVGGSWWRGRPERHLAAAERRLLGGEPGAAWDWLDLPAATPATRDRALLLRARVALERGRPALAVAPLEQVDPRGPRAAEAAFWRGRTLYAAGQPLRAIAWYRRALAARPDDVETLRWLAAAAYDLGDLKTAMDALEAVTRLLPGDAPAWRTLGLIYRDVDDYAYAVPCYEASLRADPDQPRVRLELAETLVALGRYGEAGRHIEVCRGGVPEDRWLDLHAQCLRGQGEGGAVRELLERGLAAHPHHAGLLFQQALVDLADGQWARAVARLDRALAADPYNAPCYYQRGLALRRLGRDAEGQRDLDTAAELNRTSDEMTALSEEASLEPEDPDLRSQLARLCIRLGKPELAVSWYRAALACDPGHAEARFGLNALMAEDKGR